MTNTVICLSVSLQIKIVRLSVIVFSLKLLGTNTVVFLRNTTSISNNNLTNVMLSDIVFVRWFKHITDAAESYKGKDPRVRKPNSSTGIGTTGDSQNATTEQRLEDEGGAGTSQEGASKHFLDK